MKQLMMMLTLVMMLMSGKMYRPDYLVVTDTGNGWAVMTDRRGNSYLVEEDAPWEKGNQVAVIMYTNGTFTRSDDVIIQMEYIGR